ncbi:ABC transporter permease [Leekyejoonella antrihumi]|uniref:ABC transporter permease n=1 Tax=Leekyejoonella antrihumi TaxID=1660198 RepID=A0A563DUV9_9MICO|nr:ABC transporter permease [Leekyejoonella antrihumi]TWP33692.1 ABC transporter permease [Leekyejoonella antrihumi]
MTSDVRSDQAEGAAIDHLQRVPVVAVICGLVLLAVLVCVVAGGWLAPQDPSAQNPLLSAMAPGHGHLLGTDELGRDVLSRLLSGARSSVVGPLVVAAGCLLIGATLGMAGAYFGGVVDTAVNRLADMVYALPALLIAIVVLGVVGGGYWITVAVLLLLSLPYEIRLCRSAAMVEVRLPYVDAARTIGISAWRIIFRHVLPNILPTVVATFLLDFVGALVGFAALSYLGLGVPPSSPSWGTTLAEGQSLITQNPWLSIAPAVLIIVTASSATLLGDWGHELLAHAGTQR